MEVRTACCGGRERLRRQARSFRASRSLLESADGRMWRKAELDGRVLTEPQSKGQARLGIRRIGI